MVRAHLAVTAADINYAEAGGLLRVVIPAGTPCRLATNLPDPEPGEAPQYWADPWPGMSEAAESWHRNYGFLIDGSEVVPAEGLHCMVAGYFEAIYFTDTGEGEQPASHTAMAPEFEAQCRRDCAQFLQDAGDLVPGEQGSYEQAGHDLWLTRNGHGAGFWDRPEIWGEAGAAQLTDLAKGFGELWTYQGDDGLLWGSQ